MGGAIFKGQANQVVALRNSMSHALCNKLAKGLPFSFPQLPHHFTTHFVTSHDMPMGVVMCHVIIDDCGKDASFSCIVSG